MLKMNTQYLGEAFPKNVPFYHLGTVTATPAADLKLTSSELSEKVGLIFRFLGDYSGSFLFLFDKGLDVSVYAELGNVLASRISTHLSQNHQLDTMISPPQSLSDKQLLKVLENAPHFQQTYLHMHKRKLATVHAFMLARNSPEEIGNA